MPIHNLTDVPQSAMKLGQIRKGAESTGNGPGRDLDHFRVTFLKNVVGGTDYGQLLENKFKEVYGEKPQALNVRVPEGDIDKIWDANYELHLKGGFYASVSTYETGARWNFYRDHKTAEVHISGGIARTEQGERMLRENVDVTKPVFVIGGNEYFLKPIGRLQLIIEELSDVLVGYFEFRPQSPADIRQISAELGLYSNMAASFGKSLSGVPLRLFRREEEVSKRIKGKLTKGTSHVVHIDVMAEWGAKALAAMEKLALPEIIEAEEVPLLESEIENAAPYEEMSYDAACLVEIETKKKGVFKRIGDLDASLLNAIINSDKTTTEQKDAALVVLKQDFNMEPV